MRQQTRRDRHWSTMPVPSSWGSINPGTSTTHASEASTGPYLTWIKRDWFRRTETRAPRKDSSPVRRPPQCAW
jgi:hypothetical protein